MTIFNNHEILVQKFGGSSLSNPENIDKAVEKISKAFARQCWPVVIVSAMGRMGNPFATDTLLNAIEGVSHDVSPREKDLLLSCGETISTVFMATALKERGYKAIALTGGQAGITTDSNFGEAKILNINPTRILNAIKEGMIPVIAGFQGLDNAGNVTTLGRGGSDITAIEIAVALRASCVEIYTDVDGVMTADPKIVVDAKAIPEITFNEMLEMAKQGAKVIHPRAAEIAGLNNMPIRIISTFSEGSGTVIKGNNKNIENPTNLVTGITSKKGLAFISLSAERRCNPKEIDVFKSINESGINVDFINLQPSSISFLIDRECATKLDFIFTENNYEYEYFDGCCKVTIVGNGIGITDGVYGNVLESLSREGIEVYQARNSLTSISCLLKESDEEQALKILHKNFKLEEMVS